MNDVATSESTRGHWLGERSERPTEGTSPTERSLFARQLAAYRIVASNLGDGGRVLDVACGTGYGAEVLAHRGGRITGVDIDPRAVAHCRREVTVPNCEFRVASGVELPFPNDAFDVVVSFQTIEHVEEHERFVGEIRRVLMSGGLCAVTTPNRRLRLDDGQRPWNPHHVREYDAEGLARLLRTSFERVDIRGLAAPPPTHEWELRRIASARRVAKWDPLGLRHRLPTVVRTSLVSWWNSTPKSATRDPRDDGPSCDPGDFFLSADAEASLDLFAVCS